MNLPESACSRRRTHPLQVRKQYFAAAHRCDQTLRLLLDRQQDRRLLSGYGRGAEAIRDGKLRPSAIDWLKCNFFKTELELGHCLRLPEEGPCECDLYLTCAKFVTTPAYAPRLRVRRHTELTLAADAKLRGWIKEEERHRAIISRIDQLLEDLRETREAVDEDTLIRGSETKSFCAQKLKSDRETRAKGSIDMKSTRPSWPASGTKEKWHFYIWLIERAHDCGSMRFTDEAPLVSLAAHGSDS